MQIANRESTSTVAGPRAIQERETEVLYLLGRPPLHEDLGYLMSQTSAGEQTDVRDIAESWRAANDVVIRLQTEEAGVVENPPLLDLPAEMCGPRDRLLRNDAFQRTLAVIPLDVKMVELDRLIVPQKYLDLLRVRQLREEIETLRDPRALFDFCMPLDRPREAVRWIRTSSDSFVFASPSHDLRYLDVAVFDPQRFANPSVSGLVAETIGLMVGYSVNCVAAMHAQNRLILVNGTHRAAAMRQAGFTHAPCVIQKITRPEERMLVGAREVNRNPAEFLAIPRPMMLKDFFDMRLCRQFRMPRRMRQVKVSFSVESFDAPVVD